MVGRHGLDMGNVSDRIRENTERVNFMLDA